jgi:murein DD-endopeptidase MepM/ murein hydrolase activator NlpD
MARVLPRRNILLILASLAAVAALIFGSGVHVFADTSSDADVQDQIDASNAQISQLQKEIAQLQTQLNATTKQKQTLQNAVNALALNIKKINTSITLTNAQIAQKDREISQLSGNITTTSSEISNDQKSVADSLLQLQVLDDEPLALTLLSGATLSSYFDAATTLASVRDQLGTKIIQLGTLKSTLMTSKNTAQQKRADLAALQKKQAQQKTSLSIAQQTQTQLLAQTKNQESTYQAQITQKKAQEAKFEQDLANFQAQLHLKVTTGSLPTTGAGSLAWPLDPGFIITQYFGNTPFATKNPQIYNGAGHTGIDLSASPGTPIKAARSGVVLGTGNTDLTCPGASYGKWIFIKHDNGLSTLYAHLSVIGVSKGDSVSTGDVIGYSDTTGYATGPHLHFAVFASSGSEVASFASKGCPGKTYTMPVGDLSAYLNPLTYLPAVPK